MDEPTMAVNLSLAWYPDGCVRAWIKHSHPTVWPNLDWKVGIHLNPFEAVSQAAEDWEDYCCQEWEKDQG